MYHADTAIPSTRKKRGFNLVEAAIVLGVVGLVIGGIWTAASAVAANQQKNEAVLGTLRIYQETINLYKGQIAGVMETNITPTLIAAGIIPNNWVKSTTVAQGPWGGTVEVWLSNDVVRVFLYGIKSSFCAKMVMEISAQAAKTTLVNIQHNSPGSGCGTGSPGVAGLASATYMCQGNPVDIGVSLSLNPSINPGGTANFCNPDASPI